MIANKIDYSNKIENFLSDMRKFEKINLKNDGIFSFAVNQENFLNDVCKFEKINIKNHGIFSFAVNQEEQVGNVKKSLLDLIVYLRKQGDL